MVLRKYTDFTGRARRKEFWMFVLFTIIIGIVAQILDHMLGLNFSKQLTSSGWISTLYNLAVFIPSLAVTVRRFHDIGKSGWVYARFCIAMFTGVLAFVFYMVFTVLKNSDMDSLKEGTLDPAVFTGTFFMVVALFVLFILVLGIWQIALLCKDSQPGDNKWGPNPKEGSMMG